MTSIKLQNKSDFIALLFVNNISEALLNERSVEPEDAATDTESRAI